MSANSATSIIGRVRLSTRTDEHLLARAQQGDAPSFEEVYRRYRSAVFGYCLMRLSDRQAAEDATQEVFLKISDASATPVQNVKAWLFTVARNVIIDTARRKSTAPETTELESVLDSVAFSADETAFSALDVTTNVYIALRRLPTRERHALIYREFHDWPSQRIADEIGTGAGNVDVLLCRARAAFGRAYSEVTDLPLACRQATETIYRELGSGASEHRLRLMNAHMAICPRCRAEHRRSHSPRFLGGFVPWLWLGTQMDGLAQFGGRIKAVAGTTAARVNGLVLPGWSAPAKATVALAIAATAMAPGVAYYVSTKPAAEVRSIAAAVTIASPTSAFSKAARAVQASHPGTIGGYTAYHDGGVHDPAHTATADHTETHMAGAVEHHATVGHPAETADSATGHTTETHSGSSTGDVSHSVSTAMSAEPEAPHTEDPSTHE